MYLNLYKNAVIDEIFLILKIIPLQYKKNYKNIEECKHKNCHRLLIEIMRIILKYISYHMITIF